MARPHAKVRKPTTADLAREIRVARSRRGMNQGEFAREIDVSQQTVSDGERGKRLRQLDVAHRLLAFLNIAPTAKK